MKISGAVFLGFLAVVVIVVHVAASHLFATAVVMVVPVPTRMVVPTQTAAVPDEQPEETTRVVPPPPGPHLGCIPHYVKGTWADNTTWRVTNPIPPAPCPPYRHFTQTDALACLANKKILLIGNSNTRALYTAMEAVLRNAGVMNRLAAKQLCDNSKHNHSCWQTITLLGHGPVHLHYWGYIADIYHPELDKKTHDQKDYDIIIINSGANVIQALPEEQWSAHHRSNLPKLHNFAKTFKKGKVVWHTTTRLCDAQPHFKRYRYQPKYWRHRTLTEMNAEISRSNDILRNGLQKDVVAFLDGAAMVGPSHGAQICPWYDDPLHHKFLDLKLVNVLLNGLC